MTCAAPDCQVEFSRRVGSHKVFHADACRHRVHAARRRAREAANGAAEPVAAAAELDPLPDRAERPHFVPLPDHGSDRSILDPPALPWEAQP